MCACVCTKAWGSRPKGRDRAYAPALPGFHRGRPPHHRITVHSSGVTSGRFHGGGSGIATRLSWPSAADGQPRCALHTACYESRPWWLRACFTVRASLPLAGSVAMMACVCRCATIQHLVATRIPAIIAPACVHTLKVCCAPHRPHTCMRRAWHLSMAVGQPARDVQSVPVVLRS